MSGNIIKKKGLLTAASIGVGAAVLLTVLLCLVFAAIIHREILPLSAAGACAAGAAGVAVFAASLVTGRLRERQALPLAGLIAAGLVLLAALLCALGGSAASFGPWLPRLCGASAGGALLGAVMSIRQNPHRKTRSDRR